MAEALKDAEEVAKSRRPFSVVVRGGGGFGGEADAKGVDEESLECALAELADVDEEFAALCSLRVGSKRRPIVVGGAAGNDSEGGGGLGCAEDSIGDVMDRSISADGDDGFGVTECGGLGCGFGFCGGFALDDFAGGGEFCEVAVDRFCGATAAGVWV